MPARIALNVHSVREVQPVYDRAPLRHGVTHAAAAAHTILSKRSPAHQRVVVSSGALVARAAPSPTNARGAP